MNLSPTVCFWLNFIIGLYAANNALSALVTLSLFSLIFSGGIAAWCGYSVLQQYRSKQYPYFEVQGIKRKLGIK